MRRLPRIGPAVIGRKLGDIGFPPLFIWAKRYQWAVPRIRWYELRFCGRGPDSMLDIGIPPAKRREIREPAKLARDRKGVRRKCEGPSGWNRSTLLRSFG